MINQQIIDYIKTQEKNNQSKESIINQLLSTGWKTEDINLAFENISGLTLQNAPENKKKINKRLLIAPVVIILVLALGYTFYSIYKKMNNVKFQPLIAEDLYTPEGYTVIKVDEKNPGGSLIYGTTLENPETKTKIIIMKYKSKNNIDTCQGEIRQINNIQYCVADLTNLNGVIKKGIKWYDQEFAFDLTTTDANISFEELFKVTEPFTRSMTLPPK